MRILLRGEDIRISQDVRSEDIRRRLMIDDDGGCIPSRQLKRLVTCPLSRLPHEIFYALA